MTSKTIGIAAALGSAACWALGAILFKRLGEQLSSPGMALVKSFLSAALLGAVLLLVGFDKVSTEALLWLGLSGAVGIALGDTFFFAALKQLSPHTLIMLLTSGQILTVLLAVLFLGEAPTLKTWLGIGLVVAGITVVLWAKLSGDRQASQLRGIALGILSVVCMSVSMVIAKKGLAEISAMQGLFIRMLAAGLTMLLLSTFQWRAGDWLAPFRQSGLLWQFFASVCVITFGGFWLSLLAIKHLDVSIANTLNSAEPLFVLPLGVCFLREKITLAALTGSVVAVAGISLLCMS
jgi:drug/metabolite transporter (DMT)-like permease